MNGIRDHKKMLCIFLSLVCCLSLFIVPSFAVSYDFSSYALPYIENPTADDIRASGLLLFHNELNTFYFTSPYQYVYYFIYLDGDTYRLTLVSDTESHYAQRADDGTYIQNVYINMQDVDTGVYYKRTSYDTRDCFPSDILVFNSLAEGLSAFSEYIGNASKSIQTVPYYSSGSSSFGYQFATDVSGKSYYVNEQNNKFSCCAVLNGALICGSLYSSADINAGYNNSSGYVGTPLTLNSVSVSDGTLYFGAINFNDTSYSSDLKTYTDTNTCYSDMYNYLLENGGLPSSSGVDKNVYIEAGYVAYIQVADGDMELSAVMNSYSGIPMGGNPWGNNATIGYGYSNLPTAGTTFPVTGSSTIPWEKSTFGRNWLGQTKYAVYSRSVTSSDNWIVIYNPAQFSLAAKGSGELNPTIKAHFTNLLGYRKYALTQDYNVTDNTFDSYSVSDFEDYYVGTVDENGNLTESASNENMNATPSPGGTGNLADGSGTVSISDYLQQIRETLDNFANNFIGLLQSPISHVRQLISSGSEYFTVIRGLYAWLPENVQNTLESAMIVSLSIGVIGLLL